jgi:hypothetical protein
VIGATFVSGEGVADDGELDGLRLRSQFTSCHQDVDAFVRDDASKVEDANVGGG